jgi:hypothetical protein
MAQKMQPQPAQSVAAPKHYTPPSARELRAQAVQRLQVGLFGLAAMMLLVALANIIMDKAMKSSAAERPAVETSAPSAKSAGDPLADIGVQPAAEPTTAEKSATPNR